MSDGPFIYLDSQPEGDHFSISAVEANHLTRALRAQPGFRFVAFDGMGHGWEAELVSSGRNKAECRVTRALPSDPIPQPRVTLAAAVIKGPRMDWAVEKAAEMGAIAFIPMITRFTVIEPGQGKVQRWRQIALAAAKQSQRFSVMTIAEPAELTTVLATQRDDSGLWALDIEGERVTVSSAFSQLGGTRDLTVFVGPEGGFSPEERVMFIRAEATMVTLGANALRAETAVVALLGAILTGNCAE